MAVLEWELFKLNAKIKIVSNLLTPCDIEAGSSVSHGDIETDTAVSTGSLLLLVSHGHTAHVAISCVGSRLSPIGFDTSLEKGKNLHFIFHWKDLYFFYDSIYTETFNWENKNKFNILMQIVVSCIFTVADLQSIKFKYLASTLT